MPVQGETLGQRIVWLRERAGLTQYALAKDAQMDQSQLGKVERGEVASPGSDVLGRIVRALRVSADLVLFGEEPLVPAGIDHDASRVPIYVELPMQGVSSAGTWMESEDLTETYRVINHDIKPGQFVVRVSGDSMFPNLRNGDLALFEPADRVADAEIAIVKKGNEGTTIKRVWKQRGGSLLLRGDNPQFQEMQTKPGEARVIARFVKIVDGKR